MKILVIRLSSIGDIVLTTPVIRCIRKKLPLSEIHFLTKKPFGPIIENNPYINKIYYLKKSIGLLIEELKKENYDIIIDLHNNLRTLRIKKGLEPIQSYSYNKLNIQKWLLTNFRIDVMPHVHIVERYLDTVKKIGVINDGLGLDYFLSESDKVKETDIPASHMHGYIGVVIGAAHDTKKLPLDKLIEMCGRIRHPIILMGGKEDELIATEIVNTDPVKIYSACGKFKLNESADLVRKSKMIISHDTGLMHIASAFKKHIISIWGNTVTSFGMYPYKTEFEISEVKKLWCRPCSKIGYKKCPLGHFKCMRNISIDQIVENTHSYLGIS